MNQQTQHTALILISAAQKIITERRHTEKLCDYPPEYGGDKLLIQRINEFLDNSSTQHELIEALEFVKNFKKST